MPVPRGIVCPACDAEESGVIDTRASAQGIRRRRVCEHCGHRFTTIEVSVSSPPKKFIPLKKIAEMD